MPRATAPRYDDYDYAFHDGRKRVVYEYPELRQQQLGTGVTFDDTTSISSGSRGHDVAHDENAAGFDGARTGGVETRGAPRRTVSISQLFRRRAAAVGAQQASVLKVRR